MLWQKTRYLNLLFTIEQDIEHCNHSSTGVVVFYFSTFQGLNSQPVKHRFQRLYANHPHCGTTRSHWRKSRDDSELNCAAEQSALQSKAWACGWLQPVPIYGPVVSGNQILAMDLKHSKTDLVGDVQPSYDPQCLQYSHVNFWLKSRPIWISVINSDNLKYLIIIIYYLLNKFSVIIKLCFIFIEREMKHNCIDKNALSRVQNIRITKKWISDNEYYLSHYHKFGVLDTKCWQT